MYFVKDLEHINKYLRWAKAKYNITIEQVPHWNLTYILRNGIFCPPKPKIKLLTLKDIDNAVRIKYGINYSFFGMKKADGMNRRLMLNTYENGISSTNKVYPLQDWANKDVINYCTTSQFQIQFDTQKMLPVDVVLILNVFCICEKTTRMICIKFYNHFLYQKKF